MTSSGKKCVFPFKYRGIEYSTCTRDGDGGKGPWCSTSTNKDGSYKEWGRCDMSKCRKGIHKVY